MIDEKKTNRTVYLPYGKTAIFSESIPQISFSTRASNASIYKNDVQINSTVELSSYQKDDNPVKSVEFSRTRKSAYFVKSSPKILTVSEAYLPLDADESCHPIISNGTRQEISSSPHESFENHFLWKTSLYCSKSRSINQQLSTKLHSAIKYRKVENISDDEIIQYDSEKSEVSKKLFSKERLDLKMSFFKRNPYSIEEILKKPERILRRTDTCFPHHHENNQDVEMNHESQSITVFCPTTQRYHQMKELSRRNKRNRINYKVYDITV